jgi:hypothetical protein
MPEVKRLACALALSCASTAYADVSPQNAARATQLFADGRKLADAGQAAAACANFEQSFLLDPQVGTRLNLADCREQQGRFAEAYALFDEALAEATAAAKEGRATFARQRRDALDAKLAHVTFHIAQPAPAGLAIALHGHDVPAVQWAVAQRVDPGALTLDVTAPGHKPAHLAQTVAAGAPITIDIPALAAADSSPSPLAAGISAAAPSSASPSRLPLVVTIGGGVLLAGSIGIGLHARSRWSTATSGRDASGVSSAQHEADVATGVAVVGAVAAAVGVYLYVHGPHGTTLAPATDGATVGLALSGQLP